MRQAPPTTVYVVVEKSKDEVEATVHLDLPAALRHVRRVALFHAQGIWATGEEAAAFAKQMRDTLGNHVAASGDDWGTVWTDGHGLRVDVHRATVRLPGPVVPSSDLWVMLMSTLRYAMGRSSYITGLTADLVRSFRPWLKPEEVTQVRTEVTKELEMVERLGRHLGQEADHEVWKKLVQDLSP